MVGQVIPVASKIKRFPKDVVSLIFRPPVFDTTPPGVGGLTETASVRVTGISPLRGSLRAAPMKIEWLDRSIIVY